MLLTIHGTGLELTDAIKQYADKKLTGLDKFFDHIMSAEVELGVRSHHHNKGSIFFAEVNVQVPGKTLRVEREAEDLYRAIDSVKDHLKVELEKFKEKIRDKDKVLIRGSKGYQEE